MKLTKAETKAHQEANSLAHDRRALTDDEKRFVLENWNPNAEHITTTHGAFFTPMALAEAVADMHGAEQHGEGWCVDLCAGMGMLAFNLRQLNPRLRLLCIERNFNYAQVGKRILPPDDRTRWFCGDAFTLLFELRSKMLISSGVSNPPYGRMKDLESNGLPAHLHACSVLAKNTTNGAIVIIPAEDCTNADLTDRKGRQHTEPSKDYLKWAAMHPGWAIDPCPLDRDWVQTHKFRNASPKVMVCDLHPY